MAFPELKGSARFRRMKDDDNYVEAIADNWRFSLVKLGFSQLLLLTHSWIFFQWLASWIPEGVRCVSKRDRPSVSHGRKFQRTKRCELVATSNG